MSLKSKSHSFVIDGHEFCEDNIQLIIIHLLPSQNSHLLHHVPGRVHISAPLWALPCYKIYSASKYKTLVHSSITSKSKTSVQTILYLSLNCQNTEQLQIWVWLILGQNSCVYVTNSPLPKHNGRTVVQLIISF